MTAEEKMKKLVEKLAEKKKENEKEKDNAKKNYSKLETFEEKIGFIEEYLGLVDK